ncbi:MAG: putative ATPase [Nitriliruptoraceae bacterium]|jgi:putative ATPase
MTNTLPLDDLGDEPTPVRTGVSSAAPLAARMRPETPAELVGQAQILGPGTPLRLALDEGVLPTSLLLWGPPGTGKTSIAHVIASCVKAQRVDMSAVSAGVKDVRRVIDEGRTRLEMTGRRTLLFLDEIHRFSKSQQDALLPGVESGWVLLVGATTENPFFELNDALLSRCRLVRLESLTDDDLLALLDRALVAPHGLAGAVTLTDEAKAHLVHLASGDARMLLTTLEVAAAAHRDGTPLAIDAVNVAQRRFRYDKAGDQHYDIVSAFIKSMRGSDPDATLYWLFRMLEGGEDPRFIARRMVIFASEDVGMADRMALPTATAAFDALDKVGLPEAEFALAHCALALATAPKSNSITTAIGRAKDAVRRHGDAPIPAHLRDAHHKSAAKIGSGVGYTYPHDAPGAFTGQQHLPDELRRLRLYDPTPYGHEAGLAARLHAWWPTRYAAPPS